MRWPLFLLLFLSASLATSPYLVIDLDKTSISLDSGGQSGLTVSIRNPNDLDAEVTISLFGEVNSWGTLEDSELEIPAGQIASTVLYVGSPTTAAAGTYGITISASGTIGKGTDDEESVKKSKSFSVRVKPDEDFRLDFTKDQTVLNPKDILKLSITTENAGNVIYETTLLTKIDDETIDERKINLLPFSLDTLIFPYEIPNTLSPGEKKLSITLLSNDKTIISAEDKITINSLSKLTEDRADEKEFWHREITYALKNEGNNRETKELTLKLSRLEQAFMSSSITPNSKKGSELTWQLALLPGEETTVSILTYGSVLYIGYLLILVIILLSTFLTYTKAINKPPVEIEKTVIGMSRTGDKNMVVIGLYLKNKCGKTFKNVTLTDSVSNQFDVKKFESLSPDQVNERDEDIEYLWNFKEMKPFEERAIVYHMEGKGSVSLKPSTVRFQAGTKTYFKKTGKVAVTG